MIRSRTAITKTVAIAIVVIIVVAAAAVGLYLVTRPPPKPVKEEIVLGFSISLSGKYKRTGEYSLLGIRAWQEWVNRRGGIYVEEYGRNLTVKLVYYDDKSEKETAIKLYEKLITEDKVDLLLCPYSSHLTYAITPTTEAYGKLTLSHGGASNKIFERGLKYVIQVISPASRYLTDSLELLKDYLEKHPEVMPADGIKVAIIYAKTEFPMSCAAAAVEWCGREGWPVVLYEGYPKEFTPTEIAALVMKAEANGANVLIGGGYLPDSEEIVKQMKANDVNFLFCSFLVGVAMPDFYEALGGDANYFTGPTQWEVGLNYAGTDEYPFYGMTEAEFIELCRELDREILGEDIEYPEYHVAEAAGACIVLQALIEKAGTLDDDALREAANELKITTFFGIFEIDPGTGLQIAHSMVVIQWINGQKESVWPLEVATADFVFPMPTWTERGA